MDNLSNKLLESLLKTFKEEVSNSDRINEILNKTKEGTANANAT